jgi:Restriction endonuclease
MRFTALLRRLDELTLKLNNPDFISIQAPREGPPYIPDRDSPGMFPVRTNLDDPTIDWEDDHDPDFALLNTARINPLFGRPDTFEQDSFAFDINEGNIDEYRNIRGLTGPLSGDQLTGGEYLLELRSIQTRLLGDLQTCDRSLRRGNLNSLFEAVQSIRTMFQSEGLASFVYDRCDVEIEHVESIFDELLHSIDEKERFQSSPFDRQRFRDLTEELIYRIGQRPEIVYEISPRHFEELIARVLGRFQFSTTLSKRTRDGGYDIVAIEDKDVTKNKYLIECKRYSPERKVDIRIVRQLYGVKLSEGVTKAMLVTSSYFTRDALAFAEKHAWEIELKDFADVLRWLRAYWK